MWCYSGSCRPLGGITTISNLRLPTYIAWTPLDQNLLSNLTSTVMSKSHFDLSSNLLENMSFSQSKLTLHLHNHSIILTPSSIPLQMLHPPSSRYKWSTTSISRIFQRRRNQKRPTPRNNLHRRTRCDLDILNPRTPHGMGFKMVHRSRLPQILQLASFASKNTPAEKWHLRASYQQSSKGELVPI